MIFFFLKKASLCSLSLSFSICTLGLVIWQIIKATDSGRLDKQNDLIVGLMPCDKFLFPRPRCVCPFRVALPFNSGQTKGVFGEQFDAKNKLTCSICLKEFKSLPALNGHMRSHGGMRASPSLKQVSRVPPRPLQVMCCLLCFAALGVRQGDGCVPFVGARRGSLHFPGFLDKCQKRNARNPVGILSLFLEKGTKELCQCEIYKYANADCIHMQMCS